MESIREKLVAQNKLITENNTQFFARFRTNWDNLAVMILVWSIHKMCAVLQSFSFSFLVCVCVCVLEKMLFGNDTHVWIAQSTPGFFFFMEYLYAQSSASVKKKMKVRLRERKYRIGKASPQNGEQMGCSRKLSSQRGPRVLTALECVSALWARTSQRSKFFQSERYYYKVCAGCMNAR